MQPRATLRFGLCCQFVDAPIRFRTATHRYAGALAPGARAEYLRGIARDNAGSLLAAVDACAALGVGAFRIGSQILPLGTHPVSGYSLESLDPDGAISAAFRAAGARARELDVRLSFHPDQFVVLNSVREDVVESSVRELEFQARVAALVGADTLVLHGGSASGGHAAAIERLERGIDRLSDAARSRLALENDDRQFAPSDLLPLARRAGVPLVYDVHHHRCHPDALDAAEATDAAAETWGDREPWVHISSPRDGWSAPNPRPHADYVDPADVPAAWLGRRLTVDVEAKAKERAVTALIEALGARADAPGSARPVTFPAP
ncbi:MAG TPA: UV DNA damage repair endonuclease UvsE [Gemmatimonadales bacterium]